MVQLNKNERVYFDETSHSYLLDGDTLLMGVTELMKKHGLSADYSGVSEATLRKAAAEGTALHKEIETYESGEAVLISPFIQEYQKLGLKCVATEYLVSDDETVASSIDGVYEADEPDSVILVDYKFTQKYHRHALESQLSIYKTLFERQNPHLKVKALYCLHGDKKERTIKGFYPVKDLGSEWVDELLACEREGRVFVDMSDQPTADIVRSKEEMSDVLAKSAKVSELKLAVKELEAAIKVYYDRVCEYMVEHNLDKLEAEGGVFTLTKAFERSGIDMELLKKKWGNAYRECKTTTQVKASVKFKKS